MFYRKKQSALLNFKNNSIIMMSGRIVGVHSTEQSVGIKVGGF